MKNIYVKSAVVLTVICLVVSILLAVTNEITEPYIAQNQADKVKSACFDLLPDAEDFEEIAINSDNFDTIPESLTSAFRETSGMGYVFTATVKGYSTGLTVVCAIDNEGKIIDVTIASSNETSTIGGKAEKRDYLDKYIGVGDVKDCEEFYLISGATKTTTAFKNAISDAFTAFNSLKK